MTVISPNMTFGVMMTIQRMQKMVTRKRRKEGGRDLLRDLDHPRDPGRDRERRKDRGNQDREARRTVLGPGADLAAAGSRGEVLPGLAHPRTAAAADLGQDPAPEGRNQEGVGKNPGDPPPPHIATHRGQDPGPAQGIGQGARRDDFAQLLAINEKKNNSFTLVSRVLGKINKMF